MSRRLACVVVLAGCAAGCAERERPELVARYNVGTDAEPVLLGAEPTFDATYLADQASYKALGAKPLSDKEREAMLSTLGIKYTPSASKGKTSKSKGEKIDGKDDEDGSSGEEGDESEDASGETTAGLRDEARPEVSDTPPNPADRPSQGIATARRTSAEAAKANLISAALKLPIEGQTLKETMGDLTGIHEVHLDNLKVVAMTWKGPDTLETELEISIADLAASLKKAFPNSNLDALTTAFDGKFLAATGTGEIPANQRTTNRAAPGERARQAAEGGWPMILDAGIRD